jgi:hypothetical protein
MRYFIDLSDGLTTTEDRDGEEYVDDHAARLAVLDAARALLAGSARRGHCRRHWRFDVLDADRSMLFQLHFRQALSPDMLPMPIHPGSSSTIPLPNA